MKILNKIEQSGRSMVEMLGVLAIIGVLSVGGISGYSKAMAKFKLTKAQDQLSMLLINIRTAFSGSSSYDGLSNATAIQLNIVPSDMLPDGLGVTNGDIINAFTGAVTIAEDPGNAQHFTIAFGGLGTEACTSLASSDWGTEGLVQIDVNGQAYDLQDLPLDAITAVAQCDQPNSANIVTWTYY